MNSAGHFVSHCCRKSRAGPYTLLRRLVQHLATHDQLLERLILLVVLEQLLALGLEGRGLVALGFFEVVDVLCELVGKLLEAALDQERGGGAGHVGLVCLWYAWKLRSGEGVGAESLWALTISMSWWDALPRFWTEPKRSKFWPSHVRSYISGSTGLGHLSQPRTTSLHYANMASPYRS
jgi:hypothetical protein